MNSWLQDMNETELNSRREKLNANHPQEDQVDDKLGFAIWIQEVDTLLVDRLGLDHNSMTDWGWHDAYANDYFPSDAVDEFCESETDDLLAAIQDF